MLDFVDETLHQMAFFVPVKIIIPLLFTPGSGRNDCFGFKLFDQQPDEVIGIIGLVGNQALEIKIKHQGFGLDDVVSLSRREDEPQRVAQSIYADVNFGAETTPTASQGLSGLTTFFLRRQPHKDEPG